MQKDLIKSLQKVRKQEEKLLRMQPRQSGAKARIYEKVPPGLCRTLELAFEKAFQFVFLHGTGMIEKTFDKENLSLQFEAENYIVDKASSVKSVKHMQKSACKNNAANSVMTTAAGLGLGLLGIGLPDIPLLVSTVLKGIYQIALGYGFDYGKHGEKVYILRLIRTALASGDERRLCNERLWEGTDDTADLLNEIQLTAKTLSDALLVEKFIQGIPVIGVVGGFVNHVVYRRITALAEVKYQKRYLCGKLHIREECY